MGPTPRDDADLSDSNAAGGCRAARAHTQEKLRSGAKPRRPDRAVYVPRALRAPDHADETRPAQTKNTQTDGKCPKSPAPRDKAAPGTPKRSLDKQFCNVYTPPHLRSQPGAADATDATDAADDKPVPSVPNIDSAISFSDNSFSEVEAAAESFYIGDYFVNGQLGFYRPSYFGCTPDYESSWSADDSNELTMAVRDAQSNNLNINNIIDSDYLYSKGEDVEANELKRASQEINRSSKRIIKQSFDSDVLVISDPIEEAPSPRKQSHTDVEDKHAETSPKPKLEARASLKREENDWDAVFDDSGECLDPSLLEELTATVGKVHISKARNNYEQYQTRGQALLNGPLDETFAHVVEVYDFPSEFKTNDLLALFMMRLMTR